VIPKLDVVGNLDAESIIYMVERRLESRVPGEPKISGPLVVNTKQPRLRRGRWSRKIPAWPSSLPAAMNVKQRLVKEIRRRRPRRAPARRCGWLPALLRKAA